MPSTSRLRAFPVRGHRPGRRHDRRDRSLRHAHARRARRQVRVRRLGAARRPAGLRAARPGPRLGGRAAPAGVEVAAATPLAFLSGRARAILTAERVALNLLQRMCGIATATRRFVDAVAGTRCRILDTRKTAPGLRPFDRQAVRDGGGVESPVRSDRDGAHQGQPPAARGRRRARRRRGPRGRARRRRSRSRSSPRPSSPRPSPPAPTGSSSTTRRPKPSRAGARIARQAGAPAVSRGLRQHAARHGARLRRWPASTPSRSAR